ncbi:MAG: hypothetical protein ABIP11_08555 [Luteimonas sp.]
MVDVAHRKAPPKQYTATDGERRIRSFVLRRATRALGHDAFQRVAMRQTNPLAGARRTAAYQLPHYDD